MSKEQNKSITLDDINNILTKKERGRPTKDNVQLNMRYPRTLDELVRADGEPSKVITPILMKYYGVENGN
jgi:hypothetical protein